MALRRALMTAPVTLSRGVGVLWTFLTAREGSQDSSEASQPFVLLPPF